MKILSRVGSKIIGIDVVTFVANAMKTAFFTLMISLSCAGMAQEDSIQANELAPIDAEQVNINQANAETIARVLDGVGMSRAQAIVTYREEFGAFRTLDELMMVRGVGEVTLRNNEARISFD